MFAAYLSRLWVSSVCWCRWEPSCREWGCVSALRGTVLSADALAYFGPRPGLAMRRLGTPTEVAAMIVMLASEQAGFITGAHLDINGGFYFS
jgi:NAD(P)-dependent dehydrogenase (short-subunit alcohol dehydrogenase family)